MEKNIEEAYILFTQLGPVEFYELLANEADEVVSCLDQIITVLSESNSTNFPRNEIIESRISKIFPKIY